MTYKQDTAQEIDITHFWRTYYAERGCKTNSFKKLLILALLVLLVSMSYTTKAADCIHFNRVVERDTGDYSIYYHNSPSTGEIQAPDECTGQLVLGVYEYAVLVEQSTSSSTEGLETLLVTLFTFDPEVFAIVEITLILAFLTSHFGGRMVRWLGKS
jgi:hypothetical protein